MSARTSTVLAFLIALLLLQLWLLSGAIEAAQGARPGRLAAAVASGACFLAAWRFRRALR